MILQTKSSVLLRYVCSLIIIVKLSRRSWYWQIIFIIMISKIIILLWGQLSHKTFVMFGVSYKPRYKSTLLNFRSKTVRLPQSGDPNRNWRPVNVNTMNILLEQCSLFRQQRGLDSGHGDVGFGNSVCHQTLAYLSHRFKKYLNRWSKPLSTCHCHLSKRAGSFWVNDMSTCNVYVY